MVTPIFSISILYSKFSTLDTHVTLIQHSNLFLPTPYCTLNTKAADFDTSWLTLIHYVIENFAVIENFGSSRNKSVTQYDVSHVPSRSALYMRLVIYTVLPSTPGRNNY
jgi:hypothetical protein